MGKKRHLMILIVISIIRIYYELRKGKKNHTNEDDLDVNAKGA